jgi:hypothetical protein
MMNPTTVKLQLPLAVGTIRVLDANGKGRDKAPVVEDTALNEEMRKDVAVLCKALGEATEKVNLYGRNLFAVHREI